jgi:serine/threonine-protein kinase
VPRTSFPLRWLLLAAVALAACLVGCARSSGLELTVWTLVPPEGAPVAVTLPGGYGSHLPQERSRYELRTEVPLDASLRGRDLSLTLPSFDAFAVLRVAGESIDPLDASPFDRVRPALRIHVFRIPAALTRGETLALTLVVEHRDFYTAGMSAAPRLEATSYGDAEARAEHALDRTLMTGVVAVLSLLAIASALSYLWDRRRTADGWYCLLATCLVFWHLAALGVTQLLDARDIIHVPFVTTIGACIAGIGVVHAYFELGPPPRWAFGLISVLGAVALATGWRPFAPLRPWGSLIDVAVLLALGYVLVRLGMIMRRGTRRLDAAWMFAAWSLVGAAALVNGKVHAPVELPTVAWTVFVLVQAVLLVRAHAARLRSLNVALAVRVTMLEERGRSIAALNDELRKQIGDRSARLAEALSRIARARPTPQRLSEGEVVNERYRVVKLLGQGGMGAVYEVERLTDGRRFALKTVTGTGGGPALARLAREAEIATKVVHPNVVGLVDIDVAPSGVLFIVMDLVRGPALAAEAARFGDVTWARPILRQVAAGLRALHEAGIVHRDLKPANVLLELRDGAAPVAKIADFGIARMSTDLTEQVQRAQERQPAQPADVDPVGSTVAASATPTDKRAAATGALTDAGMVVGTPIYMAPELMFGREPLPSSDMWSFGIMACEVLTGKRPFDASPVEQALAGRMSMPPAIDASALAPSQAELLRRCLERDPQRRPTADEAEAV